MTDSRKHHVLETFGLSLVLIADNFVFVPYTLYLGNLDKLITPLCADRSLCYLRFTTSAQR